METSQVTDGLVIGSMIWYSICFWKELYAIDVILLIDDVVGWFDIDASGCLMLQENGEWCDFRENDR
jgi:hypothetical protein